MASAMTKKVNVSLICTVKNEEETILDWLKSLEKQTRLPDEVIIVDGGSTDRTVELIEGFREDSKLNIKLIVAPSTNIAQGRNLAIKNSTYNVIVSTDAGCRHDLRWLENLVKPFEENPSIDVASGVYLPWYENELEEAAGDIIFPEVDKLSAESFLPSSRSVAFKKEAWELVGGYPECLRTAEDTLFDLKLKALGMRFVLAKEAIVYWKVRENIRKIFKQHFNYAKGDGEAFIHVRTFAFLYSLLSLVLVLTVILWSNPMYWIGFISLSLFSLWFKYVRKINRKNVKKMTYGYLVAFTVLLGLLTGYLIGLVNRVCNSRLRYCLRGWWSTGITR
jgi:glycosyltransferase involved in cell wall biosynthesis